MIIRVIDFETTGIPTEDDPHAVVEVGWCDLPANGGWKSLVTDPGRKIPFEAMAVHHITDEECADKPIFAPYMIDGADIYVAHNTDYERKFYATDKPWICTYKVSLRVWPDMASHSMQFLRYAIGLPVNKYIEMPHRAGPDAYVCALLLEAIMVHENAPDIDTMVRWSNGPALLPRITFGKHKGSKWDTVPRDYLEWIVDKSDMSADIKANARYHLGHVRG